MKIPTKENTACTMTNRLLLIALLILPLFHLYSIAQTDGFKINVHQQSVNTVLHDLQQTYQLQLSYNDSKLSEYTISLKGRYSSFEELLNAIFLNLPFEFELQDGVYIVFNDETKIQQPILSTILFSGLVKDIQTGEALPYSTVKINGEFRIADVNGRFSFIAFYEEYLQIEVSHLGYEYYDTTIVARSHFNCQLMPVVNVLDEALVTGTKIRYGAQIGMSMGESRMNPRISSYLPGGANIGIKQILNLQAGIQGAPTNNGSQSIWGGYPGHNLILFDGITIYTFPQSAELIYPVNPLMVKDILINKGAFGSNYGNRVGGILELTGIDGNTHKSEANIALDGSAVNIMASTPVSNRSNISVAARHTWFPDYFGEFANTSTLKSSRKLDFWMPYWNNYQDMNVKFSGSTDDGDQYYISLFGNETQNNNSFHYNDVDDFIYRNKEQKHQIGASLLYDKIWNNGVNTNVRFTTSHAEKNTKSEYKYLSNEETDSFDKNLFGYQKIWKNKLSIENRFSLNSRQFIEAGASFQVTNSKVNVPFADTLINSDPEIIQTSAYIRNHIYANRKFLMDIGMRLDYHHQLEQLFLFPRIKATIEIFPSSHMNLSWGIHQQYITFVPLIDDLGNIEYIWQGFNQKGNFLQSNVIAAGWSFEKNSWNINAEIYNKSVEGDGRYLFSSNSYAYEKGRSTTSGLDLTLKKEIGKHLLIQSYTYNDTKVKHDNENVYHPSVYNRKHELKTTALFSFTPIKLSISYIYGSPTEINTDVLSIVGYYKRMDAMASFTRQSGKFQFESGISVYNIFDETNESSLSLRKFNLPNNNSIVTGQGGMPFYATLFMHFHF